MAVGRRIGIDMRAQQTRPGGRYVAYERGAYDLSEPVVPPAQSGVEESHPALYPLAQIARIDWVSIVRVFPDWRIAPCS